MFRRKSQRKQQFVSGEIQGRLMVQISLYWFLYHVFLFHAIFVYQYAELRLTPTNSNTPLSLHAFYGQFLQDYYPIVICALITLPIVVVDMMKVTHRIAGPLVRFRQTLRDLSEGKPVSPLRLRKGDLLMEFQDEFNEYLKRLSQRYESGAATACKEEQVVSELNSLCRNVQEAANGSNAGSRLHTFDEPEPVVTNGQVTASSH